MIKKLINHALSRWNIGFIDPDSIFSASKLNVSWLKHGYKDRWFADPFILDVTDDEVQVLVEEFMIDSQKGRIALLTIDRSSLRLKSNDTVLELDTHLSFPFIYRKGSTVYVIPEMAQAGHADIYTYDPAAKALIYTNRLCDRALVDPVVLTTDNDSYIISGVENVHKIDISPFDTEKLTLGAPVKTILTSSSTSQNGGAILRHNGSLYRVAQDCEKQYGYALLLQKINNPDNISSIEFVTEYRHTPSTYKYRLAQHTFNSYKGLGVVDGKGYSSSAMMFLQSLLPKKLLVKLISLLYR